MWKVEPQDDGTYMVTNNETRESYTWVRNGDNSHVPQEMYQQIVDAMLGYYESDSVSESEGKRGRSDLPTGRQAFNEQFHSHSPSGFGASGGFGTRGAAWNRSPSGWGDPGGWDLNPGPTDMYRWMNRGHDRSSAAGLSAASRFPGIQVSEGLHNKMAQESGQDLGPYVSNYEKALRRMKELQGM